MENKAPGEAKVARKVVFHRVAENLYRLESSGGYYALIKRADKQFRRSLRTKDRKLAERRLAELRTQVGNLTTSDDARLSYEEVARRWIALTAHALKPSTVKRRELYLRSVAPFFTGVPMRNIQPKHCERWLIERAPKIAPVTMAYELATMRALFDYAISLGLMLANPAHRIKRPKVVQAQITVPTREQFRQLVAAMRHSDGRPENQRRAAAGADLVELLAYSGCRVAEATALRWRDIDFEKSSLAITGGKEGTKNHEQRVIPMAASLKALLLRLHQARSPEKSDAVTLTKDAKKCIGSACRRLQLPHFSHHDFRHLFATTCIESGVDIPTVSRWLGHKDGGALAMRVYGHLRQEHSSTMIKRVIF